MCRLLSGDTDSVGDESLAWSLFGGWLLLRGGVVYTGGFMYIAIGLI